MLVEDEGVKKVPGLHLGGSPSRNFLLLSRSFLLSRGFRNLLDLLCVTPVLMKPVKRKK